MQEQHDFGQIAALNFRGVALWAIQVTALAPKAVTSAWGGSARTAFALFRRRAADVLYEKSADAALWFVAGDSRLAAVHDVANAINGDGGFGDIGGDNHFAERIRRKCQVLIFRGQIAVQRNYRETLVCLRGANGADGSVDFAHAGHEHKDVARFAGVDDAFDSIGGLIGEGAFVAMALEPHFDGEHLSFGNQN